MTKRRYAALKTELEVLWQEAINQQKDSVASNIKAAIKAISLLEEFTPPPEIQIFPIVLI